MNMERIRALTLKIGFFEYLAHCGSCWKASRSIKVCADISMRVSSNCGWKTFTRKSSRNEVKVLMTMSELGGTISFNLFKKSNDGGKSIPMLKTLGSIKSLCPVALPSRLVTCIAESSGRLESDTNPGTEDFKINSRSSRSVVSSEDLVFMSESLNIRLFLSRGAREYALPLDDGPCPPR